MFRRSGNVVADASLHIIFTMATRYYNDFISTGTVCHKIVIVPGGLELINIVPGMHEGPLLLLSEL